MGSDSELGRFSGGIRCGNFLIKRLATLAVNPSVRAPSERGAHSASRDRKGDYRAHPGE